MDQQTITAREIRKAKSSVENTYNELMLLYGDRLYNAMDELGEIELTAFLSMYRNPQRSAKSIMRSIESKHDVSLEDKEDLWALCDQAAESLSNILGIKAAKVKGLAKALGRLENVKGVMPSARY